MEILVTAGNTLTPIDRVRGVTNIFTGRTGASIAIEAGKRGHAVTLMTSHPETAFGHGAPDWTFMPYRTFAELRDLLEARVRRQPPDALVHSAAVSDYQPAGIFAPAPGTHFGADATWIGDPPALVDRAAGKVKSDEPELWLRLVRTPKLVDCVRRDWDFRGILVKFKLEVGVRDDELLARAEHSRQQSAADWMVANTLEGAAEWAYLGSAVGYRRIARAELPARLLDALEEQHRG